MINHAWRNIKTKMGWNVAGYFAKLAAGALTFIAVVVGWVFFRADSVSTALVMLRGMACLNGAVFPTVLEGNVGHFFGFYDWLNFLGYTTFARMFIDVYAITSVRLKTTPCLWNPYFMPHAAVLRVSPT